MQTYKDTSRVWGPLVRRKKKGKEGKRVIDGEEKENSREKIIFFHSKHLLYKKGMGAVVDNGEGRKKKDLRKKKKYTQT